MANVDWRKGWAEYLKVLDVGWNRNASLSPVACGHVAVPPRRAREAAWWRWWLHRLTMLEWNIRAFATDITVQGV